MPQFGAAQREDCPFSVWRAVPGARGAEYLSCRFGRDVSPCRLTSCGLFALARWPRPRGGRVICRPAGVVPQQVLSEALASALRAPVGGRGSGLGRGMSRFVAQHSRCFPAGFQLALLGLGRRLRQGKAPADLWQLVKRPRTRVK